MKNSILLIIFGLISFFSFSQDTIKVNFSREVSLYERNKTVIYEMGNYSKQLFNDFKINGVDNNSGSNTTKTTGGKLTIQFLVGTKLDGMVMLSMNF
jgi:hypothetical protein